MSLFRDTQALVKCISTINPKWKLQPNFNTFQPNVTGVVRSLFDVPLGLDFRDRIGRVVNVKGLRLLIFTGDNLSAVPSTMRFTILIDKNLNGTVPAYSDIFTSYGTPTLINSLQHWKDRFTPLKDYFRVYGPSAANYIASPYAEYIDEWIPLDFKTVFGSTSIPLTNGIIIAHAGSLPTSASNPDLTWFAEVYYEDE